MIEITTVPCSEEASIDGRLSPQTLSLSDHHGGHGQAAMQNASYVSRFDYGYVAILGPYLFDFGGESFYCVMAFAAKLRDLRFSFSLSKNLRSASRMATNNENQQLYITYFGRPADPAGLAFWTGGANGALPPEQVADLFAANPEFSETTKGKNTEQVVNSFYVNLFGRNAEQDGLEYWTNEVNIGNISLQRVGLYIGNGALDKPLVDGKPNPDYVALKSKIEASNLFTKSVAANVEASLEYAGPLAATYGVDYLVPVTTTATIPTEQFTKIFIQDLPPVDTVGLLSSSTGSVDEGGTVKFTIQTIPDLAGQTIAYELQGVQAADVDGGKLAGSVLVSVTGVAVIPVTIAKDNLVEAVETLKISFPNKTIFSKPFGSDLVNVNDLTVPTLQVQSSAASVNEGGVLSFAISSTNLDAGTIVSFNLSGTGLTSADVSNAPLSGSVVLNAQRQATVTFDISADLSFEGAESVVFAAEAADVNASAVSVINDTSIPVDPTLQVQASAASVNEGGVLSFAISSTNLPAGTIVSYDLSGIGLTPADVNNAPLSGIVALNAQGQATVTFNISADLSFEGAESVVFAAEAADVIAFAESVINDTSIPVVPTLQVQASAASVNEGGVLSFAISSTNLPAGTIVGYDLSGVGLTPADVNNAPLSGTIVLNASGQAIVTFNISQDLSTEGAEPVLFVADVSGLIAEATSVINDTSVANSTFVLTTNQDIVSGATVPVFSFIGNEQTLGQGDRLSLGSATEAVLEVDVTGAFALSNFAASGVDRLVINGDSAPVYGAGFSVMGANSFVAMGNTDIFKIDIIRCIQELVLFDDIQVGDIEVLLKDSSGIYEFNIDASKLLSSTNVSDVVLDEVPIDQGGSGVSLWFTQGPGGNAASLERLNIESINTSGDPLTNVTNLIREISVGPALATLTFTGDTSVEVLEDIGDGSILANAVIAISSDIANPNITLIDSSTLDADLTFDYTSAVAGRVSVKGAIGDNDLGLYSSRTPLQGHTSFDVILQDGNDFVVTDLGRDSIIGADGSDTIVSTSLGDLIGDSITRDIDTVDAGEGDNSVITGSGSDSVIAGSGNDTINAAGLFFNNNPDNDTVNAGNGNNRVITGIGDDSVTSGIGNDFIDAGVSGFDVFLLNAPVGPDNDTVSAGSGNNTVLTGIGNDSVLSLGGDDSINVGTGSSAGNNTVVAGDGSNTVVAGFGNDLIITGQDSDTIVASNGSNTVRSNGGNDVIAIGNGNDGVFAGTGNDTVAMEGKNLDDRDFIDGEEGTADFISFTEGDRIERSETAGVRNIEGFELLNFGSVAVKRLDLLNGFDGLKINIVAELFDLYNGSSGLLDAGPVRDVAFASLGTAGFAGLIADIEILKSEINVFVARLDDVPLSLWTEADLQLIEGYLDQVDSILARVPASVLSPVPNAALQDVRNNLNLLVVNLGNQELNQIYLDPSTAEFLQSPREDYVISLDQALVASSDDVRNGTPFGLPFQDVRFFRIDAELAISSVTVDATTVQQVDSELTRQGLIFLGQDALIQGGSEERVIITDTLTSASLVLDYDSNASPSSNGRDVLELRNAATFTANDLTNVQDLDSIQLSSASSVLGQVYDLTITQAFLAKQGGNLDGQFVITADPSLPPLSELVLRVAKVDPGNLDLSERVLVLKSANLNVRLFDTGTNTFVPLANAGEYDVEVRDALFFTENNDDLQGTAGSDLFFAFEGGDLNPGDFADGGLGDDILELEFGVFNQDPDDDIAFSIFTGGFFADIDLLGPVVSLYGLTLSEQFNLADIQGIEEFVFDPKNDDGVRFNGFNRGGNQFGEIDLFDLDVLRTTPAAGLSSGADLLYVDDVSGDAGPGFGNANLAVFTYDGDDTVVAGASTMTVFLTDLVAAQASNGEDGRYWIESGSGDDLIISIDRNDAKAGDTISAGEGDDTVLTAVGDDSIEFAGLGNGFIDAGNGANLVVTGIGDDTIISGADDDTIKSYGGNNSILAGAGNNFIETEGGVGENSVVFGNDTIVTLGGNDSIDAGEGNNSVNAGDGDNRVRGGDGNDTILTGKGNDTINAHDGNNLINSDFGREDTVGGNDSIVIGTGNDTVSSGYGNDTVVNASGSDSILTSFGDDSILFTAVNALGSDDTILAGAGIDTLTFSIDTDTDLAPRQGSPLLPGFLPGGPTDINPVFQGVDQLRATITADRTLRLADTVAKQSTAGNGIKVGANASGADVILTAGLIQPNANDGGFKVGQSLDAVSNGFFSSATDLGIINSGPTLLGFQVTSSTAISNTGGNPTQIATRRALANGFLFSDNGINGNVGSGVVGGSGDDKLTAGMKPVIGGEDPQSVEKSRGFVSYQGNGGADTITLTGAPAVADPSLTDLFSEFVRYNTAQDGTSSGQSGLLASGFDSVMNFDNGGIALNGTVDGRNTTRFDQAGTDFNVVVAVGPDGTSGPIDVSHRGATVFNFRDGGASIDDITGDKIVVGGSLLDGISGSNDNFLFDLFSVDRGVNFGAQEGLFLSNAQGMSDLDITNLTVISQKANSLAGGITAANNAGGLIVAQGVSYSALYYWNNDAGLSGSQAQVEESELRLLAKVDTNTLAADDFLFQSVTV